MSSEVDTNTLLVKAYMLALKDAVFSGGLNPNERFLLASNANRSIPASRAITKAVTNEAVYNEADLLLPLNSVAYTPGSGHESYLESLYKYFFFPFPFFLLCFRISKGCITNTDNSYFRYVEPVSACLPDTLYSSRGESLTCIPRVLKHPLRKTMKSSRS